MTGWSAALGMRDADGKLTGHDNPLFEIADFLGVKPLFQRTEHAEEDRAGPL